MTTPRTQGEGSLLGAIEGGGTKFVCAVGRGHDAIVAETRIATTTPEETLRAVIAFFAPHRVAALGVGMFGPIELRPGADEGALLDTPKAGWARVPIKATLARALGVPVAIDTDVNAAAVAEARVGAAVGASVALYVTIGTGVGGGVVVNGRPLHGLLHPELGHVALPALRDEDGELDTFAGVCPFHGRCFEGLASGPALRARTGLAGEALPDHHPAWRLHARYVGAGLASAVLTLSPERVVVGGGVMSRAARLGDVRRALREALGGYVRRREIEDDAALAEYVVAPALGARSGIAGAFALADGSMRDRAPAHR